MNRRSLLRTAALLTVASAWAAPVSATDPLRIGDPAPVFALPDSHGVRHRLADLEGHIVVLEWTNHLCPFVAKHYGAGNMQQLQSSYTARGVKWFSILSSAPGEQGHVSPDEANRLTESRGASPTAVLFDPDGKVGMAYQARTTPTLVIIDTRGRLAYAGAIDSIRDLNPAAIAAATPYVKNALDELLAGQTVSVSATRAYGCSIKYAM